MALSKSGTIPHSRNRTLLPEFVFLRSIATSSRNPDPASWYRMRRVQPAARKMKRRPPSSKLSRVGESRGSEFKLGLLRLGLRLVTQVYPDRLVRSQPRYYVTEPPTFMPPSSSTRCHRYYASISLHTPHITSIKPLLSHIAMV